MCSLTKAVPDVVADHDKVNEKIAQELENSFSEQLRVYRSLPASRYCSFKLGGDLSFVFEPQSTETLTEILEWFALRGFSLKILGAGSNLLVSDGLFEEAVIRLPRSSAKYNFLHLEADLKSSCLREVEARFVLEKEQLKELTVGTEVLLKADAGSSLMTLSRVASELGLAGLEFAAGIPASLGGAVAMNAGAHGHCMADVVECISLVSFAGERCFYTASELDFAYRNARLASVLNPRLSDEGVLTSFVLRLKKGDVSESKQLRSSCLEYRKKTQPLQLPSAGSTFRNPSKNSLAASTSSVDAERTFVPEMAAAAELLERVGLKGRRKGGVAFSELHSNWICKVGEEARASEVDALISHAQDCVRESFAVELFPELVRWKSRSGVVS